MISLRDMGVEEVRSQNENLALENSILTAASRAIIHQLSAVVQKVPSEWLLPLRTSFARLDKLKHVLQG